MGTGCDQHLWNLQLDLDHLPNVTFDALILETTVMGDV